MTKLRRIYLLSPQDLSPETIAVTFAKTSRSPKPFDEIASELTDERSARFHEKWVVGYGHGSVAEHAVLHLALENVSRLAIEAIEGNRLASYTEKSTRYQQWDADAFYVPSELHRHPFENSFIETCQNLFATYETCIPPVKTWLRLDAPQNTGESDAAFEQRVQTSAVDICRFLLPAASLANVGVTINARALEYAICKMLSSPLEEVQQIGAKVLEVGQEETPTLIKYAGCNQYLVRTRELMQQQAAQVQHSNDDTFTLVDYDREGETHILAAVLFRFGSDSTFGDCLNYVGALSYEAKQALAQELMSDRGSFDQALREFEYAQLTFEVVMDQGAYFEFKRHRMMTQTAQPLTANRGFAVPKGILDAGCEEAYRTAMRQAAELYHRIAAVNPDVASYTIPNGFNRRVFFQMNLREAFNFCRLRAAENAHFSIRCVALRLAAAIREVYPILGQYIDQPLEENWQSLQDKSFQSLACK